MVLIATTTATILSLRFLLTINAFLMIGFFRFNICRVQTYILNFVNTIRKFTDIFIRNITDIFIRNITDMSSVYLRICHPYIYG